MITGSVRKRPHLAGNAPNRRSRGGGAWCRSFRSAARAPAG